MINVLLPTNFSTDSIESAGVAAKMIPEKLNIFLFHAFDMPESLIDAMNRINRQSHADLVTEAIRLKCRQIKATHRNINNISFRVMYGSTIAAFKNYADANKIDFIFMPEGHRFTPTVRESVNYERMFKKSGIKIIGELNEIITGADQGADFYPDMTARAVPA